MNELRTLSPDIITKLVIGGDLKGLTPQQKVEFYGYRCQQAGLDPAAKPFDLLVLNGKEVLYANATASQQLTSIHKLSHAITGREVIDDVYCVFCRVNGPDGRSTENMGAVPIAGLKGEAKANAMLKATTKAIRRSVLAHMGLGMMDETEVETIPGASKGELVPAAEEWEDDDKKAATASIDDLSDQLISLGVSADDVSKIDAMVKSRALIGDVETSYNTWLNRFLSMRSRLLAKHKKPDPPAVPPEFTAHDA